MTIPHVQVDAGVPLLQIEAIADEQTSATTERVVFGDSLAASEPGKDTQSRWRQDLEELRHLMLGFDADPAQTARLFAQWSQFKEAPADSDEIRRREDEILNIFVDICSLFRRKPSVHDLAGGEAPSTEAYLFSYLRMLETQGEGLPPAFVEALRRTLAHYGVQTLDRSPELEESLLWIYKSHQRVEQQVAPILALLERRLARVDAFAPARGRAVPCHCLTGSSPSPAGSFPPSATWPANCAIAASIRRCLSRRGNRSTRKRKTHLAYLAADPEAADQRERVNALIECPQPLASFFSGRFAAADPGLAAIDVGSDDAADTIAGNRSQTFVPCLRMGSAVCRRNTMKTEGASTSSPPMLTIIGFARR